MTSRSAHRLHLPRAMRALLFAIALTACSSSEPPSPPPASTPVRKDPAAARALIEAGATVIDVRSPEEFADGHLAKAVNVPVAQVASRIAEVEGLVGGDRSRPVVVYCAAGSRAAKAKTALEAAGFTHVVNGGGFNDLR